MARSTIMRPRKPPIFRVLLISSCIFGFSLNSLATIKSFLDGTKAISQNYISNSETSEDFPSITLCDDFSVAWLQSIFITPEEYIAKNRDLHDYLVYVEMPKSLLDKNLTATDAYRIEKILTRGGHGICNSFIFKEKVRYSTV